MEDKDEEERRSDRESFGEKLMKGVNQMKEQAEKINATELLFPDNKSEIGEEGTGNTNLGGEIGTENKNIGAQLLKEDELANEHRRGFKLFGLSLQQGGEKHQKKGVVEEQPVDEEKGVLDANTQGRRSSLSFDPIKATKAKFFSMLGGSPDEKKDGGTTAPASPPANAIEEGVGSRDNSSSKHSSMIAHLAAQSILYKHRFSHLQKTLAETLTNSESLEAAAPEIKRTLSNLHSEKKLLEQSQREAEEKMQQMEKTIQLLKSHERKSTRLTRGESLGLLVSKKEFGKGQRKKLAAQVFSEGFTVGRNVLWSLLERAAERGEGVVCGCLPVESGFRSTFRRWQELLVRYSGWDEDSYVSTRSRGLAARLSSPPSCNPCVDWCNPCRGLCWALSWPAVAAGLLLLNLVRVALSLPVYLLLFAAGLGLGLLWLLYSTVTTAAVIAGAYMIDLREMLHAHRFRARLFSLGQVVALLRNFKNRVTVMWVLWHFLDLASDAAFAYKLWALGFANLSFFAFCSIGMSLSARCAIGTYLRMNLQLEGAAELDQKVSPLVSLIVSVVAPSSIVELHEILALEKATLGRRRGESAAGLTADELEAEGLRVSSMTYFGLIAEVILEHFPAGVAQICYYAWYHEFSFFDVCNTALTVGAFITIWVVLITGTSIWSGEKTWYARLFEMVGVILGFPLPVLTTIFIGLLFIVSIFWDLLVTSLVLLSIALNLLVFAVCLILIFGWFHSGLQYNLWYWVVMTEDFYHAANFWDNELSFPLVRKLYRAQGHDDIGGGPRRKKKS